MKMQEDERFSFCWLANQGIIESFKLQGICKDH